MNIIKILIRSLISILFIIVFPLAIIVGYGLSPMTLKESYLSWQDYVKNIWNGEVI
jgi:hypothetical protein